MPSFCHLCQAPAEDQCARCLSSAYCSTNCQRSDWKKHKLACYHQHQKLDSRIAAKFVLILEIKPIIANNSIYYPFLDTIRQSYMVQTCFGSMQAAAIIDSSPYAVIVAAGGLAETKYETLADKLAKYARKGGVVLHGMDFSSSVAPGDLNRYWSTVWNIPWTIGSYQRTDSILNPGFLGIIDTAGLLASCCPKALCLKVIDQDDAIYTATEESLRSDDQSSAVCRAVGSGRVGYIGDVNAEQESLDISKRILGMQL